MTSDWVKDRPVFRIVDACVPIILINGRQGNNTLNLMVLRSLLPPDFCPFADVAGGVSQFVDLVEDGDRDGDSDHPVLPDPLVLDVELHRELRDLGAERVGELHGAARGVRHRDDWLSDGRTYTHYYVMLPQLTSNVNFYFTTIFVGKHILKQDFITTIMNK